MNKSDAEQEVNIENIKKSYEEKIKGLMNSISILSKKVEKAEEESKNQIRINIINSLKKERSDQEYIIQLLRKRIGEDSLVIDRYLLEQTKLKFGETHVELYEELKIKIRQLEGEVYKLKNKIKIKEDKETKEDKEDKKKNNEDNQIKSSSKTVYKNNYTKKVNEKEMIIEMEKIKKQYENKEKELIEQIDLLTEENNVLKEANVHLEQIQSDLYKQIKIFNKEVSSIKTVYDTMKNNLIEKHNQEIEFMEKEVKSIKLKNEKLTIKLKEVIDLSQANDIENKEKLVEIEKENSLLKNLIIAKNEEMVILDNEFEKLKEIYSLSDSKGVLKKKVKEREEENLKLKVKELEEKSKYDEGIINKKSQEIERMFKNIHDLNEQIKDKEDEIELLTMKLEEMEMVYVK